MMQDVKATKVDELSNPIRLRSSDGIIFQVEPKVAIKSKLVQQKLQKRQEKDRNQPITLKVVRSEALRILLEWAEFHKDDTEDDYAVSYDERGVKKIALDEWDREFLAKYDQQRFTILNAAMHVEMTDLMNIMCQSVAETIRGKTPEEIRLFLGLEKEFTPDEEAEIKRQNNELQLLTGILR